MFLPLLTAAVALACLTVFMRAKSAKAQAKVRVPIYPTVRRERSRY